MMNEDAFWDIMDRARNRAIGGRGKEEGFEDAQERALREVLLSLTPEAVADFDRRMSEVHARAYRWDLWGAAYWMGGGCSDDGFMDFRYCLISLGKDLFHRILADPDVLAETVGRKDVPYMQSEGFGYVPRQVYEELTGREMPQADPPFKHPANPAGEDFDFDDKERMRARYPKLTARLPEGG